MPNIWTHFIYGQELMRKLGHDAMLQDSQLRRVFNLGCQGPDFLFYYHFLPWKRDKKMVPLGSAMHQQHCGPFLIDLIGQVRGRGLYNPAVVYVLGFLSHHLLDRQMHPYVFYQSGFKKWNHQRFEIILDTRIAKKKLRVETWRTPVWKEIYVGPALPKGVVEALSQAAASHYPELVKDVSTEDWEEAYRDMIRAQKLFHDPSGVKRILTLGQIEPLVYKKKLPPLDYLNEARTVWNCPTSKEETYTHSVWDLWEIAMDDGAAVMSEAIQALQDIGAKEAFPGHRLAERLGNLSYETGKPCDSGLEIVHVNPMI